MSTLQPAATPAPRDGGEVRVALIILTHDRHRFVEEAVAAARAQTYPHLELIISDDGSTDPSLLRLLDAFEAEGLTVLRHPPGGIGASVNAAVHAADATYVMRLDDDDLIDPPYVAEAVAAAQADPSVGIVYCRADFFGDVGGPWRLPDLDIGMILLDNLIFSTALYRREDWLAVGGYDETMREGREDHDFVLRILGLGRRVIRLDGTYFHYRRHDLGSVNAEVGESREALIRAHATIFRNNLPLYEKHAEEFWRRLFLRVDEANDLRHRYAALERLRSRAPGAVRIARRVRVGARGLARRASALRRPKTP